MSTNVHSAVILPGATMKVYCVDGMSALEVLNVQKLFNFGGQMKFENCGVPNVFGGLQDGATTLGNLANKFGISQIQKQDYEMAYVADATAVDHFVNSPTFS